MNLSVVFKKSQSAAEKVSAVLYVALLRLIAGAKAAWKNRSGLTPVIVKYAMAFMLGALMTLLIFRGRDAKATADVPFTSRAEIMAQTTAAAEVIAQAPVDDSAVKAADLEAINQAAMQREAQYMARVLYGTARYHNRATQEAVCWCIINRVESSLFPNSVEEVCSQSVQWVGYSSNNPVTQELYDVACEVLNTWHDKGIRMIPQDYLYMSWSEAEIVLRTSFNETSRTHYWHVNN